MSDAVNNEEQGLHLTDDQVKYLANSALMTREALAQQLEGGHIVDVNKECGYKDDPTIDDYVALYEREGVANRVIRLLPEETWQVDPYVYETEDATETAWEKLLAELVDTHNLWAKLEALDVASGIGQFGGMIIGLNDGQKLATPVKGFDTDGKVLDASAAVEQREILYLRVYSQKYLKVIELETNQSNLRYGLPKMYELEVQTIEVEGETTAKAPDDNKVKIHWSRVIHVTDGCINSEAYSAPRAEPNYNRLMDVRKTLGGAAGRA